MINTIDRIDELANQWLLAKKSENEASKQRVAFEKQLIEALEFTQLEGSNRLKTDQFKVTLTAKLNKKLDVEKWLTIRDSIPDALRPVIKETPIIEYKIDDKGMAYIKENNPEVFTLISEVITLTPAKTAVKVEVL